MRTRSFTRKPSACKQHNATHNARTGSPPVRASLRAPLKLTGCNASDTHDHARNAGSGRTTPSRSQGEQHGHRKPSAAARTHASRQHRQHGHTVDVWGVRGCPSPGVPRSRFAFRGPFAALRLRPLTRPYRRRSTRGGISTPENRTPRTSALRRSHGTAPKARKRRNASACGPMAYRGTLHRCTPSARARAHRCTRRSARHTSATRCNALDTRRTRSRSAAHSARVATKCTHKKRATITATQARRVAQT